MFYSNEVVLLHSAYAIRLSSKTSHLDLQGGHSKSVEDIIAERADFGMHKSHFPTIKSRLFKIVDVMPNLVGNSRETKPSVIIENIDKSESSLILFVRACDLLYSTGAENNLPSMNVGRAAIEIVSPLAKLDVVNIRDSSADSISSHFTDSYIREKSEYLQTYKYLRKYWWDYKIFVDSKDSRVHSRRGLNFSRPYLNKFGHRAISRIIDQSIANTRPYLTCIYCHSITSQPYYVGEDICCAGCYREVEIPCGLCFKPKNINDLLQVSDMSTNTIRRSILESLDITYIDKFCVANTYRVCGRCNDVEVIDVDKIQSLQPLTDRRDMIRDYFRDKGYIDLEQNSNVHCSSCATQRLNSIMWSPGRARTLGRTNSLYSKHEFTRHIGIESEVCMEYDNVEEYIDAAEVPDYFEAVEDSSVNNGIEFRNDRPIIGREIDIALNNLQDANDNECNYVDDSCGVHIHFNALDFGFVEMKSLLMTMSKLQSTIYDSLPNDRIEHTDEYAKEITYSPIEIASMKDLPTLVKNYYSINNNTFSTDKYCGARYVGTNLHARFYLGTIEFRYHEGTTDSSKIKDWIRFLNSIMNTSKTLVNRPNLYKKIISKDTEPLDIINMIGGRESVEYIERRIDRANN